MRGSAGGCPHGADRRLEAAEGLSKREFFAKHGFVLLPHKSAMTAEDWLASESRPSGSESRVRCQLVQLAGKRTVTNHRWRDRGKKKQASKRGKSYARPREARGQGILLLSLKWISSVQPLGVVPDPSGGEVQRPPEGMGVEVERCARLLRRRHAVPAHLQCRNPRSR